jgi:hypothetical protein
MSAQQMKERPSALRAMFSSLSSLFSGKDRSKPAAEAPSPETAAPEATATPEAAAVPEAAAAPEPLEEPTTPAEPADTADTADTELEPETVVVDELEPEVAVIETEEGEVVVIETEEGEVAVIETEVVAVEADPVTGEPELVIETDVVVLPLASYDTLTVASLRARLRNLSVEQLTELLDYEKANAARPDVITMFERRIAKIQTEA